LITTALAALLSAKNGGCLSAACRLPLKIHPNTALWQNARLGGVGQDTLSDQEVWSLSLFKWEKPPEK
jgi:hypothetical protein